MCVFLKKVSESSHLICQKNRHAKGQLKAEASLLAGKKKI